MYTPLNSPGWDYEDFKNHETILPTRAANLLYNLRIGKICSYSTCKDNRHQHGFFFSGLTPAGHDYFAGHYRGEPFPGLKQYEVRIGSDPRVGVRSDLVGRAMHSFARDLVAVIDGIEKANTIPSIRLSPEDKLLYIVRASCKFFVEFLRIHPYANGNGHMGRFFIFSFLNIFSIWPKTWPLNDRPPDPPYSALISSYRNGYCEGLEKFVLKAVIGK